MDESEQLAKIFEPMMVIMELGERDLEEELQLVKGNFSTDKFNKMVMEVMGTLVQLHNDSVPYLDGEEKASEEDLKELKNDIKQAGLLVSEMASIKILGLTNEQAVDTSRCIKTLFKSANREAIKAFASELSWQMILDILIVWKELPGISFLVGNMTSKDREQRMTAKGVADYLEGKCKPRQNGKSPEANLDNPSVDNPSVDNPSVDNPSVDNPSVDNPSVDNPSVENASVDNPSVDNPSVDNQPVDTPSVDNQSVDTPSVDNQSVDNPSVENASVDNPSPKDSWNVHLKMTLFGDVLVEKKLDDFEKIVIAKSLTSSAMEGIEHFVHELAERTEFCEQ
ncbi:hypothetical protein niasHT_012063 [Heterodera trifolii]|uniref:Uncharacterized protein n=1 Tax=Heterodera trifolii TaxID=157864 RepID=A0ABD2LA81_9BILA